MKNLKQFKKYLKNSLKSNQKALAEFQVMGVEHKDEWIYQGYVECLEGLIEKLGGCRCLKEEV